MGDERKNVEVTWLPRRTTYAASRDLVMRYLNVRYLGPGEQVGETYINYLALPTLGQQKRD
jgi:hypothetical protein